MTQTSPNRNTDRQRFVVLTDYTDGEEDLFAYCQDVSATGLFIKTHTPPKPGSRLKVRFRFPHNLIEFEAQAEVIWVRTEHSDKQAAGMGLKFLGLSPEQQKSLSQNLEYYTNAKSEESP